MFGLKLRFYIIFKKIIFGNTKLKNFIRSFSREIRPKTARINAVISKQLLLGPH